LKKICLLGATGSIGDSTVSVIEQHPDKLLLKSVVANRSWQKVLEILKRHPQVEWVALFDEASAQELKKHTNLPVFVGMEGILKMVRDTDYDSVVNGLVGSMGCMPTLIALEKSKEVALANKESMVMAGTVMRQYLDDNPKAKILPVDSEHNAIFQCLHEAPQKEVEKLILTASGGPFRELPKEEFKNVTLERALKHPTWSMGPKITIDSSTLMNKGLEVIEAHFLFDIPFEQIDVAVHPKSIVHSMVQFKDGSLLAQMGVPDMRIPIIYSLSYPERWNLDCDRLDLLKMGALEFFPPDTDKFPCLRLAYEAGKEGGSAPAILNATNEVVVEAFLNKQIRYIEIPKIIEASLNANQSLSNPSLDDIINQDQLAREWTRKYLGENK
jgi:1-deoxy-D-xylulose-5-phosphate reductoisomerase